MWHFIVYLMLFAWGLKIIVTESWSPAKSGQIDSVWVGYPHGSHEKPMVKAFITVQVAWYLHGFVESLLVDHQRVDFVVMLVHHVLACCLLTGAFWGNAHRVAVLVCVEQVNSSIHVLNLQRHACFGREDHIFPNKVMCRILAIS